MSQATLTTEAPAANRARAIRILPCEPPFGAGTLEDLGIRGLHVGCGPNLLDEGWLNVDIKKRASDAGETAPGRLSLIGEKIYYLQHDATTTFPFHAETFDWIYSEHFIEHISPEAALGWLRECRRLLKRSGTLRISTPNLQTYMRAYFSKEGPFFKEHHKRLMELFALSLTGFDQSGDDESIRAAVRMADPSITDAHFQKMKQHQVWQGLITRVVEESSYRPAFMVNQIFRLFGHQWIYDHDEIAFVAQKAGFTSDAITQCHFRQGSDERISGLDDPMHNDESLYVELRKV